MTSPVLVLLSVVGDSLASSKKNFDVLAIFYVPEAPLCNNSYEISMHILSVPKAAFERCAVVKAMMALKRLTSHLLEDRLNVTVCVGSSPALRNQKRLENMPPGCHLIRAVDPADLNGCMYCKKEEDGECIMQIKQNVCDDSRFSRWQPKVPIAAIGDHVLSLWPQGMLEAIKAVCHTDKISDDTDIITIFATVNDLSSQVPCSSSYRISDGVSLFPILVGYKVTHNHEIAKAMSQELNVLDQMYHLTIRSSEHNVVQELLSHIPTGGWTRPAHLSRQQRAVLAARSTANCPVKQEPFDDAPIRCKRFSVDDAHLLLQLSKMARVM